MIACGIFLAGVAYLHWSGGALGSAAVLAMRFAFGALGYAVPAALLLAGGLILARDLRPPARPMRFSRAIPRFFRPPLIMPTLS